MQIYTTLQRGQQHKHFCEDFLFHTSIGKNWQVGAVADGCSGGRDSHFASTLTCKLLRKITQKEEFPSNLFTAKEVGLKLLKAWFVELEQAQKHLQLEIVELLSTLILMVFNKEQAWITVLGDGVVAIGGNIHIIDQNNIPDYPIYHLKDTLEERYNYLTKNSFETSTPQNLAIATDGILSFVNYKNPLGNFHKFVTVFLLCNSEYHNHTTMLNRKYNILQKKHQLLNSDDLSIIRLLN